MQIVKIVAAAKKNNNKSGKKCKRQVSSSAYDIDNCVICLEDFNNGDKFHINMDKGIKEWKNTGWTWDQSDSDTQVNGDAHSANLAYNFILESISNCNSSLSINTINSFPNLVGDAG